MDRIRDAISEREEYGLKTMNTVPSICSSKDMF